MGIETTSKLFEQKEQLLRSKDAVRTPSATLTLLACLQTPFVQVDDTDSMLGKARDILRRMARRTMTNKLITGVIIFVEVAALIFVIWYKFLKDKN